jgi:adenylate cyclase
MSFALFTASREGLCSVNPDTSAFDEAIGREVLRSERLRATIIAALFSTGAAGFVLVWLIRQDVVARVSRGQARLVPMVCAFAVVVSYELYMRGAASRALRDGTTPAVAWRYVNAAVETSLPTALILVVGHFVGPVAGLLSPAPFLYFFIIALSALRLDARLSIFTGISAGIQYLLASVWALSSIDTSAVEPLLVAAPHHFGKAMLLIATGGVTGLVASRIRRHAVASIRSVSEKERVVALFGQHVSAAVVEKLLAQPSELESETRHVCIMFLDIRDFTTFSENKRPEEVVAYLNSLWGFMIDVVNAHGGIINKFLGDGFMAMFGAPVSDGQDCKNAVRAAKAILERVAQAVESGAIPKTRVGIGLHAGLAVTGNIGGSQRKEYSVIGDVVNLASRIEGLNKTFDSQLLLSEAVQNAAGEEAAGAVALGPAPVKGRAEAVNVYKLV